MHSSPHLRGLLTGIACLIVAATAPAVAADVLTPQPPLLLAGTKGKFDFIKIDAERRRLLLAHTGNGSLDIVSLDDGKLLKSVATGAAQDSAISPSAHQYLVSVSKPPQLSIVDAESLEQVGAVPLSGPADLLAFHGSSSRAFVGHDDSKEIWVVDVAKRQVTATIALAGEGPEGLEFDETGQRLFQAVKLAHSIAVIDLATNKVMANWSTLPAHAPHGIALVPEANAIAVAGGDGKIVLLSQADGKVLSSGEMPEKVDEIGYDRALHRLYCASSLGKIAVFHVRGGQLEKAAEIATSPGAKSIAIDPTTHSVWIAYVKGAECYAQAFRTTE